MKLRNVFKELPDRSVSHALRSHSSPSSFAVSGTIMSYPTYPVTTQPGQQGATAYPYSTYPPGPYGQSTPGTTPYPTYSYPTTGVTGYGTWPYTYNYTPGPQQAKSAATSRPTVQTAGASSAASTLATPRTMTFTSYTPSHLKESVAAASSGGATGRGSRKQTNFKGLFTKECELVHA